MEQQAAEGLNKVLAKLAKQFEADDQAKVLRQRQLRQQETIARLSAAQRLEQQLDIQRQMDDLEGKVRSWQLEVETLEEARTQFRKGWRGMGR